MILPDIVQYVKRTHETVVLGNAKNNHYYKNTDYKESEC